MDSAERLVPRHTLSLRETLTADVFVIPVVHGESVPHDFRLLKGAIGLDTVK